jgi:hypothetical protein
MQAAFKLYFFQRSMPVALFLIENFWKSAGSNCDDVIILQHMEIPHFRRSGGFILF